jgi:broad specificity phosphatase PhoE
MVTRVLLIEASPTPWDAEGRISGRMSLPLSAEAIDAMRHLVDSIEQRVAGIYCPAENEACDQVAKMVGKKFDLRARDSAQLHEVRMGLWEGLTRDELKLRYPTVFPQWFSNPLSVTPPEGEPVEGAIVRIGGALGRILKRNRGLVIALALRPMALQIAEGIILGEPPDQIARHLQERQAMASMEIGPRNFKAA